MASGTLQHVRHEVLHLGRVLGGGMDGDVAILARDGERDLAFEIEVLLPADAEALRDAVRRARRCAFAASPRLKA